MLHFSLHLAAVAVCLCFAVVSTQVTRAATVFDDPANELADPTITSSQIPFSGSYSADKVFDNNVTGADNGAGNEYATGGNFADAFINMDFGTTTTVGGYVFYQRGNNVDTITSFTLTFSDAQDFSVIIDSFSFATSGSPDFALQGDNAVNGTPDRQQFEFSSPVSARYIRWESIASDTIYDGAAQMEFWRASAIPEPSSLLLGGIALLTGLLRRKR